MACLLLFGIGHGGDRIVATAAAPTIYAEVDGLHIKGPIVDIARRVLEPLDLEVDFIYVPWKRAMKMLEEGQVDVLLTTLYRPDRADFSIYSEPYRYLETSVFVPKGNEFVLNDWSDLIGKIGVKYRGASEGYEFDQYAKKHLTISEVTHQDVMLKMVAAGRADYGFTKRLDIIKFSLELGLSDSISILDNPLSRNPIHFAVSKQSRLADKIEAINARVIELRESGEVERIIYRSLKASRGEKTE